MTADADFRRQYERVGELVRALEELPDTAAREAARELTRALFGLHAAGLRRMLDLAGADAVERFTDDEAAAGVLLLHGLHPLPPAARVSRALDRVRPQFHAVGGDVEVIRATDEVVRLRLHGDPAADRVLRSLAGEAILDAVPEVAVVEFEEVWDRDPHGRVSLPLLAAHPAAV